ncbi:MAG: branched-chain amino acid ABC transporter permease [Planctomycetes bacterium]|nr:branched-chain amino acid ABC transporter permease [Planctomycetota bacterium]
MSLSKSKSQLYFWAGGLLFVLLGLIVKDHYLIHVLILCFLWCMVASSWDLVMGYAGIFNYAHLVFFAVGAYASAMLSTKLGITPAIAIVLAGMITGLFGMLVGVPCLRLKGEYVALFTFAVHLAMPTIIMQGRAIGTGGNSGILGVPTITFFGFRFHTLDKTSWYYLSLFLAAVCVYTIYFIVLRSRSGHAFVALRDSEDFAKSLGINDYKYKIVMFTISAVIAGIAGAFYAHYTSVVTPKILGTEFFLIAMVMLSIGGLGLFPGSIIGAFIITIGNEFLRGAGQFRLLILGLVVVLTLLFLPNGIVSIRKRIKTTKRKYYKILSKQT